MSGSIQYTQQKVALGISADRISGLAGILVGCMQDEERCQNCWVQIIRGTLLNLNVEVRTSIHCQETFRINANLRQCAWRPQMNSFPTCYI